MLNNILADKYGKDTVSILAVRIGQMDFEQAYNDAITATVRSFFGGKPSTSDEYNNTITAGSAKPMAVETRRDAIKALL